MLKVRDFYCHDFTFFFAEAEEVVHVGLIEGWHESMPDGLLKVEGHGGRDIHTLLFTGYFPCETVLVVREIESC